MSVSKFFVWWTRQASNLRQSGYEPGALPTELRVQQRKICLYSSRLAREKPQIPRNIPHVNPACSGASQEKKSPFPQEKGENVSRKKLFRTASPDLKIPPKRRPRKYPRGRNGNPSYRPATTTLKRLPGWEDIPRRNRRPEPVPAGLRFRIAYYRAWKYSRGCAQAGQLSGASRPSCT